MEGEDVLTRSFSSDPVTCSCRGACLRRCPCKASDAYCTRFCHICRGNSTKRKCRNQPPLDSSASSASDEDEENQRTEPSHSRLRERQDEAEIQKFVQNMSREKLESVAAELLRRQPDSLVEFLSTEDQPEHCETQPKEQLPWCLCGKCIAMPTEVENKCCRYGNVQCLTETDAFIDICLNANVLGVNMRVREDELAEVEDRSNANYRYYAYRNYVYWRFGRLGRGNRMVLPSCCVLKIRERFPDPDGAYTGYIPGDNLPA